MADTGTDQPYRVLARKYRPRNFAELIGQEALVRTLGNAIATGRLAHAFILTGVRGVGKTTTARIIARALNCVGPDGSGGPTIAPCGACENCRAIAEDRHVDVLEMDAASRTGVNDIRELIDGVRYLPVQARNKVYIIDEVHMLSRNAFNALLKTLEEPPPHVTFIFATTEIRKVPITVLSRCQRFDLKRVGTETLITHFGAIAEKEGVDAEPQALALIARAAEGSVRDGLSLLDQAVAHGAGTVTADQVQRMLGLVDRAQVFDLFDAVMEGNLDAALTLLRAQYIDGADPMVVLEDMLNLSHWLTTLKLVPDAAADIGLAETDRVRGKEMADKLSMPVLSRCWQMLLKGLDEVRVAPMPINAAEMVLIRIAYASDLPDPADLVRRLQSDAADTATAPSDAPAAAAPAVRPQPTNVIGMTSGRERPARRPDPEPAAETPVPAPAAAMPDSFEAAAALLASKGELVLAGNLRNDVSLVTYTPGRIEFKPLEHAPPRLANQIQTRLSEITGERWVVSVSNTVGAPSISEQRQAADQTRRAEADQHPLVAAAKQAFPGAEIRAIRDIGGTAADDTVDGPDEPDHEGDDSR